MSEDLLFVKKQSKNLIELNNKRKEIECKILSEINFELIGKENRDIIIYYNPNIKEGLIGIIASRLKDYFNKPSIVITKSKNNLKGSARSSIYYNIGSVIKKLIDNKILLNGGGHNMAAGFTMNKNQLMNLENYILRDYALKNKNLTIQNTFDAEISASSVNQDFNDEINRLGPFGNGNPKPKFLIKDLKIIKVNLLKDKHISVILKPNIGRSIKCISFNSANTPLGYNLISCKKNIHVIAEIHENNWNNKNYIQLNIKDVLIKVN